MWNCFTLPWFFFFAWHQAQVNSCVFAQGILQTGLSASFPFPSLMVLGLDLNQGSTHPPQRAKSLSGNCEPAFILRKRGRLGINSGQHQCARETVKSIFGAIIEESRAEPQQPKALPRPIHPQNGAVAFLCVLCSTQELRKEGMENSLLPVNGQVL